MDKRVIAFIVRFIYLLYRTGSELRGGKEDVDVGFVHKGVPVGGDEDDSGKPGVC